MKIVRLHPRQRMIETDGPETSGYYGCYAVHEDIVYLTSEASARIFIHELLHVVTTKGLHRFLPSFEVLLDRLIERFF